MAWGAGASHTALDFTRSTDGGQTFEPPRRILGEAGTPSLVSAGPQVAAGPDGLVCVVCDWTTKQDSSGDMTGQVVAVCSTDAGDTLRRAGPPGRRNGDHRAARRRPAQQRPNGRHLSPGRCHATSRFPCASRDRAHSDIVVTASRDRGRTWSTPVTATPADGAIYFQPNLAVDAAGRVAISAFALTNGRMDEVLLISHRRTSSASVRRCG